MSPVRQAWQERVMDEHDSPEIIEQKRETTRVFGKGAPTYGQVGPRFFSYFGCRLVEAARIPSGAKVLDVATGRGAVLFPAATTVGAQGHVTGIDLSKEMVEETSREIEKLGLHNAEVRLMDAEHLQFPDESFDFVLCSFAIHFFPQLPRALSEMNRALNTHGRLAVSTWGPSDERSKWFDDLVESYLPSDVPEKTQESGARSKTKPIFNTPEGLTAILASAGFANVEILSESKEFTYADENEFWATLWSHGARRRLEAIEKKLGKEGYQRFQAEVSRHLKMIQQTGEIAEVFTALFGFAARH